MSQVSHGFQIGGLTVPTSLIAMIVHCGAQPFGAMQLGDSCRRSAA